MLICISFYHIFIFLCSVPQVKWMKADKVIKPSKYFRMSKEGDLYTLRISEAFPEDEGPYKCVASSPGGQTVLSANLVVLGNAYLLVFININKIICLVINTLL